MDIQSTALKHGVDAADVEHAVRNAMVIDELDDDLRLYLGPTASGALLEVIAPAAWRRSVGAGDPRHADA